MSPQTPSFPELSNGHHGLGSPSEEEGGGDDGRARALLVRDGPALRELAEAIRRAAGAGANRLEEVEDLYEALSEIAASAEGTAAPVRTLAVTLRGTGENAALARDAVRVIDPSIRLVLLCPRGSTELARSAGFDQVVSLPAGSLELAAALQIATETDDTAGTSSPPAPWQTRRGPAERTPEDAAEPSSPMPPVRTPDPRRTAESAPSPAALQAGRSVVELVIDDAMQAFAARRDRTSDASEVAQERRAGNARAAGDASGQVQPGPDAVPAVANESLGDTDLVESVMAGGERLVATALSIIRRELAIDDLELLPLRGESDAPSAPVAPLHATFAEAPVRHGSRNFGSLRSRRASAASLGPWAEWLGHWMRLDASHQELRILAWTDELTGAGNRRAFERVLEETINEARGERRSFSLMYFDIDEFKGYNDRFGHDAGDEVLREVVELLRAVIRRGDHVFRVGGDEFVVIFADSRPRASGSAGSAGSPIESVTTIANRFRDRVCDLKLAQLGMDAVGTVSVSAGVATYPWDGHDAHSLLSHADQLALQSKRSGKNTITFGRGACLVHPDDPTVQDPSDETRPSEARPASGDATAFVHPLDGPSS